MRAYALYGIGDLRAEEKEMPCVGPGQVLVQVRAAGICGSDIPRIYQTGTYSYSLIPGHEFSGVVTAAGDKEGERWLGRSVGIFPLIPCGECDLCRRRQYELCRHYSYLGSRTDGGFAEYVAVPWRNLVALPEGVSFESAAMLEPMAVAVHAIRQSGVRPGQTAAVYGMGTIGLLIAMFLREAGVDRVLAIGNKDCQGKAAQAMGIAPEDFCDARVREPGAWLLDRTGGTGAEVFFECIGRNQIISEVIGLTAPMGMVQLVGNPAGDVCLDKSVYWKILRNQLTVRGSWNSSFTHEETDDWHYVLRRLADRRIFPEKLITHRFAFAELQKGLAIMRDKSEEYVKVMVRI